VYLESVNSEPFIYTLLVAGVFLVTSLIFILYDQLVSRRQRIVMKKPVLSAVIVSSLYPKQVRDRIFEEDSGNKTSDTWKTNQPKTWRGDGSDFTQPRASKSRIGPLPTHTRYAQPVRLPCGGQAPLVASR
jgi:hypothetical protein